ncbi:TonB-dependent receptor [Pseudoduganella albidiflava]|uniref:TonB-dependent receptor n=1 Tax=Pseudoduganella albidiflava TaxID=321983 RepID=A0A411WXX3_9BURK|nr:TonB-dependent receptor [Pseudoduganella albidiflava]QBI01551.1 TonB-dependent receptor [Pseudoduganella albidiflava]GGY34814.1 TonB-dependent receptor [Pseudoduganella albidiflava]
MRYFAIPALGLLAAAGAHAAGDPTVVIAGQRVSLANAIAAQEKADNIVSVVSSDGIGGLPDKNAAEALARLPGVAVQRDQGEGRYVTVRGLGPDLNAVTINGALVPSPEAGTRAVALDVLPAGLIRTLEVSKTLTPDQDANSLGGTVEVKTLSAFDLPGALLTVGAGASHDTNTGQNSPNANLLWAQRFAGGKLGVAAGLSGERRKFGSDNVETGGAWSGDRLEGFELREYLPVRERYAAALNLDWRPDAASSYALRGFVSRFSDDEVRDRLTVGNLENDDLAEGETGEARVERRLRQRKYTQEIRSLTASADRRLAGWRLHAEASASRATDDAPESVNDARFRGSFDGIGFTNTMAPRLVAPAAVFDPASYNLNAITLQQSYAEDRARALRLDLTRELDDGLAIKFGAKASRRDKDNDTNQWTYDSSSATSANFWGPGTRSMSGFVGKHQLDYAFGPIGTALDPAAIRARVAGLPRAGAQQAAESALDDFSVSEDIDAAYVQGTLARGAWSLLAGVRAERTRFKALGRQIAITEDEEGEETQAITPRRAGRSYTDWLPTLQARYDIDRATSMRAAWSNSVVRANFSQLAPGVSLDSATEATIGNPDLAPLKSRNLDLGIERVLGNDGTMSAYVFHKDIRNFTYATNLAGSGQWADYTTATSYANGDSARVKGIELAWQQPLRMLPAPFNGLLVGMNAAFTRSRAAIDSFDEDAGTRTGRTIRMPGQSNRMANAMIGYEHGPLSTRLAVNYKSPYLLELGENVLDAGADRIVDAQTQLDFSLAWQLGRRWQLTFEASNLNNEKYYVYQGVKQHNVQYEQYGRTYKVGLKASLF